MPDGTQERWARSEAGLLRQRDDRKPERAGDRHGLLQANGTAERDAALLMAERLKAQARDGGGRQGLRHERVCAQDARHERTPHVSQNHQRPGGSAIDGRTSRHAGYQISQGKRKRIEEVFGWMKTVGMLRKTRHVVSSRWMGFHICGRRLQPGAMRNLVSSQFTPYNLGRSVSKRQKAGIWRPRSREETLRKPRPLSPAGGHRERNMRCQPSFFRILLNDLADTLTFNNPDFRG